MCHQRDSMHFCAYMQTGMHPAPRKTQGATSAVPRDAILLRPLTRPSFRKLHRACGVCLLRARRRPYGTQTQVVFLAGAVALLLAAPAFAAIKGHGTDPNDSPSKLDVKRSDFKLGRTGRSPSPSRPTRTGARISMKQASASINMNSKGSLQPEAATADYFVQIYHEDSATTSASDGGSVSAEGQVVRVHRRGGHGERTGGHHQALRRCGQGAVRQGPDRMALQRKDGVAPLRFRRRREGVDRSGSDGGADSAPDDGKPEYRGGPRCQPWPRCR